jgi:hypothetical protein
MTQRSKDRDQTIDLVPRESTGIALLTYLYIYGYRCLEVWMESK